MRNFFQGTKFKITLALFISLLLGVFFAAVSTSGTSPVSSAVSYITTPLQNVAVAAGELFSDFTGYFVSSHSYAEEVSSLKEEISELKNRLVDYEKTKHKLDAYEEFLEVKDENPDFTFVPSSIILRDTSEIYGTFTLNSGSADGINIGDPVISGNALVGVIREVTENSSTVYTLFHPSVSVSTYEIRTREDCYTEAETEYSRDGFIKLSGLTKTTPVVSGGIVCTSGIGGVYPRDLIIGTIKEIKTDEVGISAYALIIPDADYSLLTDVFVITDFEGKNS